MVDMLELICLQWYTGRADLSHYGNITTKDIGADMEHIDLPSTITFHVILHFIYF